MATGLQDPKASGPYDPERAKKRSTAADTHEFILPDTGRVNAPYDQEKSGPGRGGMDDIGPGHGAASAEELGNAENQAGGGFYNPGGDSSSSKAESRGQLKNSEDSNEGGDDSGLYNDEGDGKKKKSRGRFRITRKRGAIIGIGSSGIIAAVFGFLSISSGPLEFVHIAQLMEQYHFSNQEDAEDNRLSKVARYIYDPDKPQNTRLGIVGNVVADKLEAKINDATGLQSDYDTTTGSFKGYKVLTDNENWQGLSEDEIKASLINKYGGSEDNITVADDGTITYNPDTRTSLGDYVNPVGSVKAYRAQMNMATGLMTESDLNKVSGRAAARVLKTRAGWTFHPIEELDSAIQNRLVSGGKAALDRLKKQFNENQEAYDQDGTPTPPAGDPEAETKTTTDSSGHTTTTTDPASTANQQAVEGVKDLAGTEDPDDPSTVSAASTSLTAKIAGGGAGLIGVVCVLRGLDSSINQEREAKVILPMERFAGQFLSLGSQIQSGQDIDSTQLGFFKQYLDGTNSSGAVTSTWDQADSIQAEEGNQTSGTHDIPTQGQVFTSSTPFGFLNSIPLVKQACGVLSSPFGTLFSIVTGPVSSIVSSAVIKESASFISNWLTGEPINFTAAAGADDGSYLDYGSRLAANQESESAGGVPMSTSDESDLNNTSQEAYTKQFESKSLTYRIFNPDDSQTLASKLMDSYGSQGVTSGFASMFRGLGSIFSDALKAPAELFSSTAHAASEPYDYHGLQASGFTAAELSDPTYDNPFDNACYVVGNCKLSNGSMVADGQGVLGSSTSPNTTYINQIAACFNDQVSYNGTSWNIDYTGGGSTDVYSSSYPTSNCESTDTSWMRIRFWLLDTQTIEGYDCSQGSSTSSDQSCQDLGFSDSTTGGGGGGGTPTDGGAGTTTTTTSGATFDLSTLDDSSVSVACAAGTKDIGIYTGYTDNNPVKIRLCAISNLPSSGEEANGGYGVTGAGGKCPLNSRVSGAVYAMVQAAQKDGVTLTTDSCFRTEAHQQELWQADGENPAVVAAPGTSNHQMGLAMDFSVDMCDTTINGQCSDPGNPMWDWVNKNAGNFGYKSAVATEAWHWSPTGD